MHVLASTFHEGFGNVLVFAVFGAVFVFLNLYVIGKLLLRRPHKPEFGEKAATYECAEPAIGDAWIRFDIRFYTLSLVFLVFDIEVALLFPWAAVYNEFVKSGLGAVAFFEVLAFLLVLGVGLAFVWVRRDLDWTTSTRGRTIAPEALVGAVQTDPMEAVAAGAGEGRRP